MSPEQRLDRLERLAKLLVRAGVRERSRLSERINILIDAHIDLEDLFVKNEERFAKNEERFRRTEQAIDRLVAVQARTNRQLQALINAIRGRDPGYEF